QSPPSQIRHGAEPSVLLPLVDRPRDSVGTLAGYSDVPRLSTSRDHPTGSPYDVRDSPPTGAAHTAHTALSMGSTSSRASLLHVRFVLSSVCSFSTYSLLLRLFLLF